MIPNLCANGASFRGAGAYYLHDKPFENETGETIQPDSAERVAWTVTRNLMHDEPAAAIDGMWLTAERQQLIKQQAGGRLSGRKCDEPVKTISLSWHPDQAPSKDDMISAADDFLRHMGWHEHQALYVAHNDTPHAHVHIILNRVHPGHGKTLDGWRDFDRAQQWSLAYEREHGVILCQKRLERDYGSDERADRLRAKIPHSLEKEGRGHEAPYLEATEMLALLDGTERDLLHKVHTDQREAFFKTASKEFRGARQGAFVAVANEFKPEWRRHFQDAHMLRAQARELAGENAAQAFALAREGKFGPAWDVLKGHDTPEGLDPVAFAERHIAEQASAIALRQKEARIGRQQEACAATFEARNQAFLALKLRQKDERAELRSMADAHRNGEAVDTDRLRLLLTGDARKATDPNALMRDLATANDNARPLDEPTSSNDNAAPQRVRTAARVRTSAEHMDRLVTSIKMTNRPGMAATQTALVREMAKRARRAWEAVDRPQPGGGATRADLMTAADTSTPESRARDAARYGADAQAGAAQRSRDRDGGRDG